MKLNFKHQYVSFEWIRITFSYILQLNKQSHIDNIYTHWWDRSNLNYTFTKLFFCSIFISIVSTLCCLIYRCHKVIICLKFLATLDNLFSLFDLDKYVLFLFNISYLRREQNQVSVTMSDLWFAMKKSMNFFITISSFHFYWTIFNYCSPFCRK